MNSVVEWRETTTARTGRPDRVALSVRIYVCVCVWALGSVWIYVCVGWLKHAYSFHETTKQKCLEN